MEPVTFIALASIAVAATARPRWDPPRVMGDELPPTLVIEPLPAPTNMLVAATARTIYSPFVSKLHAPVASPQPQFLSLKDRLLNELAMFQPGYPGGDPGIVSEAEDVRTASMFLKTFPAGVPLPVLMRSDDGQIGMYWDIDDIYIDINIDPASTLSMFSRVRSTGVEHFIEEISLNTVTADWISENIGSLILSRRTIA